MASIFISYRQEGGSGFAGRIEADLERRFGKDEVFRDVDDLASGKDFVEALERALENCRVLIVVIGKTWLSAAGADGGRRLDNPRDFVRMEIAAALARDVLVLPVLVGGARMPAEADLPDELKPLARRQALELTDARWDYDLGRLADSIRDAVDGSARRGAGKRKRRFVLAAAAAVLVAAAGSAWHLSRLPDLGGMWDMPNGSYWIVEQAGRELTIREVHYESKEVWKKGHGSLEGDTVQFELEAVFQPGYFTAGRLQLGGQGRRLTGTVINRPRNTQDDVILSKR